MKTKKIVPYLLISPFIISFFLLFLFPAGYSFVLSFFDYRGYGEARFVGLSNYESLLSYAAFWKGMRNTTFYFIMHIVPVMCLSFLLAIILQSKYTKGFQKIFKPILYLPQVVPVMAITLVFRIIFAKNSGVVNQLLGLSVRWLEDSNITRLVIVFVVCWRSIGWFMVIFLAGLTSINQELYESARIDGANAWQSCIRITIPLMKPTIFFAFIMDAISSFKIYTEVNALVAAIGIANTDVAPIMNQITTNISNGRFGMASAAGWLLFLVIVIITFFEKLIINGREKEDK